MEDYNVEGRLVTKDDWENWLKMKEEYSDRHLSNIPEPPTKKETKAIIIIFVNPKYNPNAPMSFTSPSPIASFP